MTTQTEREVQELSGLAAEMIRSLLDHSHDIRPEQIHPVATQLTALYTATAPSINRPFVKGQPADQQVVQIGGPFGATSKFLRHTSGFLTICAYPERALNMPLGSEASRKFWTTAVQEISRALELAGQQSVVPERAREYAHGGQYQQ